MKRLLLHLFVTFPFLSLFSQTVEREELLSVYTYSFAKSIQWGSELDEYKIQVISANAKLRNEFKSLSQSRTIQGKPITVSFTGSPIVEDDVDIVFVDASYNLAVRSILNQVIGEQVLTITDGFDDERFIMINFVDQADQTLSFQINNANIINQGLNVLEDEMFLLGGSEVDVAKLYREAQDSLESMETRILALRERSDSLGRNVQIASDLLRKQGTIISRQTSEIATKQRILERREVEVDSLGEAFSNSQGQLDSLVGYLSSVKAELLTIDRELTSQRDSVRKGNEVLSIQNSLILEREAEIRDKESELKRMETVVVSQSNRLFYLLILSIILVLFSIVIYRAYTARRRDARKLAKQKSELSEILGELREAQTQLVQSEKMASLGVLIAGIAHEINNAINFVYSGIHIIKAKFEDLDPIINKVAKLTSKERDLKKKVKEIVDLKGELDFDGSRKLVGDMVGNVQIGAERTIEIIKGLKTFSKSETENKTRVNLHKDMDIALLLLESRHKNIVTIEKKYDEDVPEIDGYQGQLGQAFLNIIGNALDALEGVKNPKVTIKTKRRRSRIDVSIKDNGAGIESDIAAKIFDPFFTTKGIGTGTGLGLSITYGIVEKHNGTIRMNSRPGSGAEFIIQLPLS